MVFGLLIFILTYFYAYKLGNLLGGKFFGLALALVITSNVYFNQLTRSMIFPFITLYPLLFLSSFYYLLSSHRVKNNSKLFSLIGLSVSLAFCFLNGYSNTNAILLGLLGGFFLFLIFYLKILNRKDYQFLGWNHYGFIISFAVFWVFLLSSLWSNFLGQHNFYGIDAILHDRVWGIIIGRARVSALMSKFELSSIWNAVQNIIYALYFPNRRTAGVGGIHEASFLQEISFLNPIEGVFFILGVFFVFKNLFSKSLINCFLAFLIPFFLYRAVTSGEGAIVIGRYNYDFYFVTLFFVSYGLIQVIKTKKKLILILLFILIFNIKTFNSKFIWDSNERLFQSFGVYQLRNLYREEISKENNLIIYDYSVFPHGYLYHIDLWSLLEKKVDYDVFGKFFTGEMANSLETFEKFIKTMPHKHLYLIIPTATKYNFSFNPKLVQAPSYLGTFSPYKIIVNRQGQPTFWVYKFPKKP